MIVPDPSTPKVSTDEPPNESASEPIEGEDYYFDGPYLVFTEAFHLRRGFCCQSGCRHCPYGFRKNQPDASTPDPTRK